MTARTLAALFASILIGALCALRMVCNELDATRRENIELRSTLGAYGLLPESRAGESEKREL